MNGNFEKITVIKNLIDGQGCPSNLTPAHEDVYSWFWEISACTFNLSFKGKERKTKENLSIFCAFTFSYFPTNPSHTLTILLDILSNTHFMWVQFRFWMGKKDVLLLLWQKLTQTIWQSEILWNRGLAICIQSLLIYRLLVCVCNHFFILFRGFTN